MDGEVDFDKLYQTHYGRILRLCRQMLGSRDRAEDAAQEVFMRAYRNRTAYDGAQPFEGWIVRIATHHCIDLLRRRGKEARLFGLEAEEHMAAIADGADVPDELLTAERADALNVAIETLPERYRLPLVLVYFGGHSYDETAARLGLTRTHVGALICRAKQALRKTLRMETRP